MSNKTSVPFGGVCGWLADLTVPAKQRSRSGCGIQSYYVAEPDERRALAAIRIHAEVSNEVPLASRRALSMREVQHLGLKPGQVVAA
jgi:hypothetical protein